MKEVEISLEMFGNNLGTRLLGKKIFEDINPKIQPFELVILDFKGVKFISFSFASEVLDNLKKSNKKILFKNDTTHIRSQLEYALKLQAEKDL